jgi:hypothetical protein
MNNLYDGHVKAEVMVRINSLRRDSERQWGTMDVAQMLAHCAAQLQFALGENTSKLQYNAPIRWMIRQTIGFRIPWPKNLPTAPEMTITDPRDLDIEKAKLIDTINRFYEMHVWHPHPIFGEMTKMEWGLIAYKHLDHHLRQFGV